MEVIKMMKKLLTILAITTLIGGMALAADTGTVPDPTSLGVGARAIGMGRTYVGVAEDADALFMNPAGLALSSTPKLSSMYTSLMNDINYIVVGGVYPYGNNSAIGAGIINTSSDILLTNSDGSSAGSGNWGHSVLFLSAGTSLSNFGPFKNFNKNILVGGNFKYFSLSGSGSNDVVDASDSSGTGYDVDLGILYPATKYLTLGANYQNLLHSKIMRSSGKTEDLASTLKIGGKLSLIGKEGSSYTPHKTRRLYLNADYDIGSSASSNPMHYGLEFWPVNNLALRVGMDGDDMTAGIGINLGGFAFNYAYHPYSGISDNATSYFSIAYVGDALKRVLKLTINTPNDQAIIYDDHIKVSGKVEVIPGDETQAPAGAVTVKINGVNVSVNKDMTFSADIPVDKIGKKMLLVEAKDAAGDYQAQELKLLRLINFADVPQGYWAKQPIENTGTVGLVEGYPDGTFKPNRALTRAELATLLVRAKGLKLPDRSAQKVFKDVKPGFWAAKYIEVAQKAGLVKGYPDGSFRPNNKINKAEGIAILARFENLKVASEVFEKPYWDVSANHWAAKYISAAKEAGMLKFVKKNYLNPSSKLARAEAVEMLSKTTLAGGKVKDLYSWEKGFKRDYIPERPSIIG
jgi:hypothetical protein